MAARMEELVPRFQGNRMWYRSGLVMLLDVYLGRGGWKVFFWREAMTASRDGERAMAF